MIKEYVSWLESHQFLLYAINGLFFIAFFWQSLPNNFLKIIFLMYYWFCLYAPTCSHIRPVLFQKLYKHIFLLSLSVFRFFYNFKAKYLEAQHFLPIFHDGIQQLWRLQPLARTSASTSVRLQSYRYKDGRPHPCFTMIESVLCIHALGLFWYA